MGKSQELSVPALAIKQGSRVLYSFAVDGKQLPAFTTVSRIHRDEDDEIDGYQRPEALAHIRAIQRYVESEDPLLPNALVVAFDRRVKFQSLDGRPTRRGVFGRLVIPIDPDLPDDEKPGWVVDGQQRSAAIRDADVTGFPVFVTAFITDSVSEQRSQFILVNSTKPLPKGLIHELLPATPGESLPIPLLQRRFPALLLERLNRDAGSPMKGRILTPTTIGGTIKDNSVLKMLSSSLADGALYPYFDPEGGGGDIEKMLQILKNYWSAVVEWFPEAWGESPRHSRLVHGAGIGSMGCLMDEITYALRDDGIPDQAAYALELSLVVDACRWTGGTWTFSKRDRRAWNKLQNTPGDIALLSDYLVRLYRARRREATTRQAA